MSDTHKKTKVLIAESEKVIFEGDDGDSEFDIKNSVGAGEASSSANPAARRPTHLASTESPGSVFLIASDGRVLSLPIPSESHKDPLNWARSRRIFVYSILLVHSALAMFLIQTPANLYLAFLAEYKPQDMAPFSIDTLAGSPTLLMGISFFFWIPLCVAFGRRPVILSSAVVLTAACVGAGFAHGFHQLLTAICFIGFAGGATISTTILEIIDITFIHERPLAIATFWSLGGFLALQPLAELPVMMDTAKEWRPLFKATSIPLGIITILIFLFVPETLFERPPVAIDGRILVQSSTERVSIYDEWQDLPRSEATSMGAIESTLPPRIEDLPVHTWRVSPLGVWQSAICKPKAAAVSLVQIFLCAANPLAFWVCLLNAVNFGGMMLIGIGFPVVLAQAPYNFGTAATGRVNITAGCGSLLALPFSYVMLHNVTNRLTRRNKGVRHAEFYLPAFVLPVTTGAASVFVYGLAAHYKWHPVYYHVAYGLNAFSYSSGSIVNTIWVTESLPQWAAAAVSVVGGVSYIASWGITAALPAWQDALGVMGVSLIIGSGILFVGLFAVPLAFWGESVRQFISGRWGAYEMGALRPQPQPKGDERV